MAFFKEEINPNVSAELGDQFDILFENGFVYIRLRCWSHS